mmetsp:Transcript_2352/g.287  ORF Transcript_2352/g.287 Transcript_2352/m.287 type:complete len:233 (-) Transcript_2352:321-1019(-)
MMSYSAISIICMASIMDLDNDFIYIVVLEVMYMNVVINHISNLFFFQIALSCAIILVSYVLIFLAFLDETATTLETSFFLLIFIVINTFISFLRERQDRNTYNLQLMANHEIDKTENLLSHLMPPHVLGALKEGTLGTDSFKEVTILYADICGFTNWSSDKLPIEVVSMLSELFTTFDHLCVTHFVYKVHTIGDCYVVLGFTDAGEHGEKRDPVSECINVTEMAMNMIKSIQ